MNDFGPDDFDILSQEDFQSWKGLDMEYDYPDDEDDDDFRMELKEEAEMYRFNQNNR